MQQIKRPEPKGWGKNSRAYDGNYGHVILINCCGERREGSKLELDKIMWVDALSHQRESSQPSVNSSASDEEDPN